MATEMGLVAIQCVSEAIQMCLVAIEKDVCGHTKSFSVYQRCLADK